MKRVLVTLVAIAMLGMYSNIMADEGPDKKGIRAGWQHSSLTGASVDINDPSNGFYVGFFTLNNIVPLLKWESGLEYYQIGGEGLAGKLKLHYLSLPLSLRFKLGPVYALGGVNGALKLGSTYDSKLADFTLSSGDFKTFDFGTHVGVGFKFLMLGVEARYNWGLVDIIENEKGKTEYLQIGAVLYF